MENITNIAICATALVKLVNLQNALEACGIPTKLTQDDDGAIFLSAPLWNCENDSGEIFQVYALPQEDFEIGSAIENSGKNYGEIVEEY